MCFRVKKSWSQSKWIERDLKRVILLEGFFLITILFSSKILSHNGGLFLIYFYLYMAMYHVIWLLYVCLFYTTISTTMCQAISRPKLYAILSRKCAIQVEGYILVNRTAISSLLVDFLSNKGFCRGSVRLLLSSCTF